jgi:chaperonin GroES
MNKSGIQPVDRRVLVKPETFEEYTEGGIYIPDESREREEMGHVKAELVAVGSQAFEDIENPDMRPRAGMMISIARYAGYLIKGIDGVSYRIINDTDVVAVLDGNWDIRSKG